MHTEFGCIELEITLHPVWLFCQKSRDPNLFPYTSDIFLSLIPT